MKTAAGRHAKNTSSNNRVKSKERQDGSTLGPNVLSLLDRHIDDAIAKRSLECCLSRILLETVQLHEF